MLQKIKLTFKDLVKKIDKKLLLILKNKFSNLGMFYLWKNF